MAKPEILEIVDVHPGTTAELEEAYIVHKLWLEGDVDAFLARIGPGVRGIATNGIAGTKGVPLAALPKLEIVGVFGVGVDAVDLETARSKGVRVTNTPDVLTEGVAELGMALLLDVARCVTPQRPLRAPGPLAEGGRSAAGLVAHRPQARHPGARPDRPAGRRDGIGVRHADRLLRPLAQGGRRLRLLRRSGQARGRGRLPGGELRRRPDARRAWSAAR